MAKFYRTASGGVGLRRSAKQEAEIPVPGDATNVVPFDERTNASVIDEFNANYGRFAYVAGVLTRDGVPVVFAADSSTKAERDDFDAQVSAAVTRLTQIKTLADSGMTNAQRDSAIGDLAVIVRRSLRIITQLRAVQEG